MFSGQLDRRLIGFSPGVAEEDAVGTAVVDKPAGQFLLLGDPIQIRHVLKRLQLAAEAAAHGPIAVAKRVGRDAGDGIQIATSLVIPTQLCTAGCVGIGYAYHRLWMGAGGLNPKTSGRLILSQLRHHSARLPYWRLY